MFKNRAVQMSLVRKDADGNTAPPPVETQADVIAFASDAAKDVIKEGGKVVAIYVVLDTIRKVVVTIAAK